MSHAITVGGLLIGIGLLAGSLALLIGLLSVAAEGMSDAASEDNGKSGRVAAVVGLVLIAGSLIGMFA